MAESGRSLNGGFQVHRVKALPWPRAKAPLEGWRGTTASFIMTRAGGLLPRYQQSMAANTCNRDTQPHQAWSGNERSYESTVGHGGVNKGNKWRGGKQ